MRAGPTFPFSPRSQELGRRVVRRGVLSVHLPKLGAGVVVLEDFAVGLAAERGGLRAPLAHAGAVAEPASAEDEGAAPALDLEGEAAQLAIADAAAELGAGEASLGSARLHVHALRAAGGGPALHAHGVHAAQAQAAAQLHRLQAEVPPRPGCVFGLVAGNG